VDEILTDFFGFKQRKAVPYSADSIKKIPSGIFTSIPHSSFLIPN